MILTTMLSDLSLAAGAAVGKNASMVVNVRNTKKNCLHAALMSYYNIYLYMVIYWRV